MRPIPGSDGPSGAATSIDAASSVFASSTTSASQISFVLAEEAAMDASFPHLPTPGHTPGSRETQKRTACPPPSRLPSPPCHSSSSRTRPADPSPQGMPKSVSPCRWQPASRSPIAPPATPLVQDLSGPPSAFSSPSSQRVSLTGSLSEDRESCILSTLEGSGPANSLSLGAGSDADVADDSQFIMPTIPVPTGRPFTEEGKGLGRLKLLVAGMSGIGKTSLIHAIVQSCHHIVHADPATPVSSQDQANRGNQGPPGMLFNQRQHPGSLALTETFASTKPYPTWWSTTQVDSPVRRHNKCDSILEKNVCFVDTPGFGLDHHVSRGPKPVTSQSIQYIEDHLRRGSLAGLSDSDVLSTLSSSGGLLVDAVIYMIPSSGLTPIDVQFIRRVEPQTSIIPVLAQADMLDVDQIEASKRLVLQQLNTEGIVPFDFETKPVSDSPIIYAISTQLGSDSDNMDASLLMSSQYAPPLVESDLVTLIRQLFDVEGSSRLRHATARKLLDWRHRNESFGKPLGLGTNLAEGRMTRRNPVPGAIATSSYGGVALVPERWAKVHLVNWAADLQRSLANERTAYELRLREQRVAWLREQAKKACRLETGADRDLEPPENHSSRHGHSREGGHSLCGDPAWPAARQQDPLGLVQLGTQLKWTGLQGLEFMGGMSVASGLAVWLLS